ncbi:MAG: hypothetical protein K6F37_00060 [Lachnospiraceae bacterium]|nr:hypothetical protein [Lachnospiraceae bacterium]
MINEDKIKTMTKLAAFDESDAKKYSQIIEYYRSDYIGKEMLKSTLMGTIAYVFCVALWFFSNADDFLKNINNLDYMSLGMDLLKKYLLFLLAYLFITYVVYAVRYSYGQKKVKNYHKNIHNILKSYDE